MSSVLGKALGTLPLAEYETMVEETPPHSRLVIVKSNRVSSGAPK